jgi:hypothetical protein
MTKTPITVHIHGARAASVGNRAPAVLSRSERGAFSSARDPEVGGSMRVMREQPSKRGTSRSISRIMFRRLCD